jgi:hypothetical protein
MIASCANPIGRVSAPCVRESRQEVRRPPDSIDSELPVWRNPTPSAEDRFLALPAPDLRSQLRVRERPGKSALIVLGKEPPGWASLRLPRHTASGHSGVVLKELLKGDHVAERGELDSGTSMAGKNGPALTCTISRPDRRR